jgi:hypothetical protein
MIKILYEIIADLKNNPGIKDRDKKIMILETAIDILKFRKENKYGS